MGGRKRENRLKYKRKPISVAVVDIIIFTRRYLQKTRYKKHQKKADKSTNVFCVAKKGKNNAATITTNNKTVVAASNNVASGGGVTFIIPKIEHPEEPTTATVTTNCKPTTEANVSSIGM